MNRCNICQKAYSKSMCRKWKKRRRNLYRFASAVLDCVKFGCCNAKPPTGPVTNGDKVSTAGDDGACPNIVFIFKLLLQTLKQSKYKPTRTGTNECHTLFSHYSSGFGILITRLLHPQFWRHFKIQLTVPISNSTQVNKCCENMSAHRTRIQVSKTTTSSLSKGK